uniref:S1 RNA-binding domain-containing protein n=1 Tax=Treponema endosymbiont of Eucomonympha sp. TaxID=1580831 RepID=UPI000A5257DE
ATGTVTKLTEFGAFIELSFGIEGLAHVSELSWTKKIGNPSDMLKIGDKVEYKVLGYDIQAGRVSLSLRQAMENPWDTVSERYPVNMRLTRPVTKVIKAGAFIQLEEGIDAFLHIDDYSWTKKIRHPGSELSVGQEVETVIIENNPKNRRIRLSIKHLTENPWQLFASAHPSGSAFEGEIASITGFGLFVRASEGIEGLVNRADLVEKNENFAEAVKQYKVGDKINVLVLETNIEKQQSAFSVRKLKEKQKRDEIAQYMTSKHDEKDNAFTLGDLLKIKTN